MPLKIVKRGKSPNWYIRGTVRGVPVDESTGTPDKGAAEEIRIQRAAEILHRSIHGAKASATFLEAAVMHMENGGEKRFLEKPIAYFGTTKLSQIKQAVIDAGARANYPGGLPSTIDRQWYAPVSAVINFANRNGLAEKIVIRRPTLDNERVRWITLDEVNALISSCAPHLKPLVTFLIYTGARMSEALYADWRQINLSAAQVTFPKTKNRKPRSVPLHPRVIAALANLEHRDGPVFLTNRGLPYTPKPEDEPAGGQIKTGFNNACKRAGIEDFHPHDCRHTWATWHYAANKDLVGLQKLGGWKTLKMVLRYAHTDVSEHKGSIDALPGEYPGSDNFQPRKVKGNQ